MIAQARWTNGSTWWWPTRVDREDAAYRRGHRAGNRLLTGFVAHMFGHAFTDILSGYRVFSRRFVKSFPVLSGGFEIETELTVHALELELPVGEVATPYYSRPSGSASKLSTWRDGFRILWTVLKLYRAERPLSLFGAFGIALAIMSIGLAIPIFITYLQEGLVPRLPTAVLSTGPDAARVPVDCLRPDPRYGHAGAARAQADRLSGAARAGRGAAAGLIYLCEHWPQAGIAAACPILAINLLSRFLPEASTAASKCGRRVVPNTAQLT